MSSALSSHRHARAGFTLVELMVAITGGLFVSIIVFSISKNSARFYQSETRVGEATLAEIVGFERLRADVARAGFLSSPNIVADPRVCGGPPGVSGFPTLLATLSAIQVTQPAGGRDSILLAGSYSSTDYFAMRAFGPVANTFVITLDPKSGALTRLGYNEASDPAVLADLLDDVFLPGRAVRIVDRSDKHYYGIVRSVNANTPTAPEIVLEGNPSIQTQQTGTLCGIDQCTGCTVNVVNFIRYDVADLRSNANYAALYAASAAVPYDDTRTELRRVELDPSTGQALAGTEELVTQYAVDLKFGLLVDNRQLGAIEPDMLAIPFGSADVEAPPAGLHRVRGVRVRLGVRTRDADRDSDLNPDAGLYRIGVGDGGAGPFARVRTLQADVMLNNTASIPW
jgi:hypothetical protein